jgi:hypothetical protein
MAPCFSYTGNDLFVALQTGLFGDAEVSIRNADLVGEVMCCKRQRMKKSVDCFGGIFTYKSGRGVAIVAYGYFPVAAFHPALILILHDMAVRASGSIVRHVGRSLRVTECVYADADQQPGDNGH